MKDKILGILGVLLALTAIGSAIYNIGYEHGLISQFDKQIAEIREGVLEFDTGTNIQQASNDSDDPFAAIMESPEIKRMMSRTVLEDRRCYVFNDGGYECWLPKAVCEFDIPVDIGSGIALIVSTCHGYADLSTVE